MNGASSTQAVILAGGKGTRLRPYTVTLPKPLVPVGDQPILTLLLQRLRECGITRVMLAVSHLAELIMALHGDGAKLGMELRYAIEEEPLGTAGPLKRLGSLPDVFLVLNGDILTDLDFAALLAAHRQSDAVLTIACCWRESLLDYGILEVDAAGRLVAFREKPRHRQLVSMGVYAFRRAALDAIPADGPFGFDQLVLELLQRGLPVRTYLHQGYWRDIGRPEDYERANEEWRRSTEA